MKFAPIRRSLVEPLYSILTLSPKITYWKELEQSQFFSTKQLRTIQVNRLKSLLNFVWSQNNFYKQRMKEAGLTPADIGSIEDLQLLPILTKAEIQAHPEILLSQGYTVSTLQQAKTGGSTGTSLQLFFTEECSELRNACARRHDCWTGWRPGEPIAACWGNPKLPQAIKDKVKNILLQPYFYLDTMQVDDETIRAFARKWQEIRPTLLYGHAHSIFLLAQYLNTLKITLPAPKGILSTSMMLIPSERKLIEETFGLRVTDRYGCEEVSLIGSECERHNGMHLNVEHLVIEFIDEKNKPVAPGTPGRIIVTDLQNRAMPFIRYSVEDVGVPSNRQCPCGRGLPLMEQVTGRVADFLIKDDGSRVAGVSLIENTLTKIPGIMQMQIIQNDIRRFVLKIVPDAHFSQSTVDKLRKYFSQLFGTNVEFHIEQVTKIQPEANGKYRFSICRLP
ncbi:MAG: adenylyltransferase [Desulfobulbus propionicus]|nr:MAG: adenylyltransferase [Desulfobulbus propionicus]